jgi:hypothetical protein
MTATLAQLAGLFAAPGLALAGALAVSIPIAIHLLTRLRRTPRQWAAMQFLMEAYRKHRSRLQLEQVLLLLVRCLTLLVLGLALAGPLLGGLGAALGPDAQQRLVVFILDDSLSAQASVSGAQRFASLRQQALALLDGLGGGDQVALFRAARPMQPVIAPPTLDHAAVRRALEQASPRYARSALLDTLGEAAALIERAGLPPDRVTVALLSDFAQPTLALDRSAPAAATQLGQRARLLLTRPSPEAGNVQIAALNPRRQMVLAEQRLAPTVPVELRLRRFGSDSGDSLAGVSVQVIDAQGAVLSNVQREHRWSAGQTEAVLNLELPVTLSADRDAPLDQMLTLKATLQAGGSDAIEADNTALAVVELRQRLMVAVVGDRAAGNVDLGGGFDAERWLAAALDPWSLASSAAEGPVEVVSISASTLDAAAMATVDAAFVVRPDLLADAGWQALGELMARGGLVVLAPPMEAGPAVWAANLRERFGADWQVEIEPVNAPAGAPWSLASDAVVPEPLRLLSADWQALLRPIRVTRRLAVRTVAGADQVWLRTSDGQPLLLAHGRDEGQVLLLASAIAPDWSNLPTKPLFVPLLHETMRGVLGSRRATGAVAGEQPALGWRWGASESLASMEEAGAAASAPVLLRRSDEGLSPVSPLEKPGVWVGRPVARGLRLAVNVDADAGDTRPLDERALGDWFTRLGRWQWLEPGQVQASLVADPARTNWGWPLLWVVLALLLLETALARWFSHARLGGPNALARLLRVIWGAR